MGKGKNQDSIKNLKPVTPCYSMRELRLFEKGDYCPKCNAGQINGDNEGNIFCVQQGCGFSGTIQENRTTDYKQINYKLMAILGRR